MSLLLKVFSQRKYFADQADQRAVLRMPGRNPAEAVAHAAHGLDQLPHPVVDGAGLLEDPLALADGLFERGIGIAGVQLIRPGS